MGFAASCSEEPWPAGGLESRADGTGRGSEEAGRGDDRSLARASSDPVTTRDDTSPPPGSPADCSLMGFFSAAA